MGIDRAGDVPDANVETVEDKPDRPPPPPPDKPGTDGYPSRADSRSGAAAANETSAQPTDKTQIQKPEAPQPSRDTSGEQASTVAENKPGTFASSELSEGESSSKDDGVAGERKDTGHAQTDTYGTSDTGQASKEAGDLGGSGGREQTPDDWTTSQDSSTAKMGKPSTPTDAGEQGQNEGIRTTPSAENGEPVSADAPSGQDTTATADRPSPGLEENIPVPPAPRDRSDVHRKDDADAAYEGITPVGDASAATTLTGSAEDQPQTIDKPQPDPPDAARPVAEVGAAEEPATTLTESAETPGQRLDDQTEPRNEGNAEGADTAEGRPLGERLVVDGKPVRDRIDPLAAADVDAELVTEPWTDPTADLPPTGKELSDMDSDKLSRFERLRREGYRKIDDGLDVTEKGFDLGVGAFARPPTHAETRTAQPEVVEAPHHAVTAGEAASGLLAAGIVIGELVRWGHGKLTEKKERS
jgi:hypothetical protein